jgi:hypothetical protein
MIKASLKKLGFAALGFLILLLALSPVSSVFAVGLGHGFYGTVKVNGVDAAIGTVISARVAGTEYGSWSVTTPGSYALIVQGEIADGATIDFYVAGQKAGQTFPFHDGWTTQLDLTLTTTTPPTTYDLSISSTAGGSVTGPGVGNFTYGEGTVVDLLATPDADYRFVAWTGDVGTITNVNAVSTTITMHGNYGIIANFEEVSPPFSLPCFIATAAYGTPTAEQINVLQEFRDVVLLESTAGSQFVALYYQLSPPIADVIAGNTFLRTMVRELMVDPIVWVVEATGDIWRN